LFVLLFFFFWPLCCLSFFDLRIQITPLVSSNSSTLWIISNFQTKVRNCQISSIYIIYTKSSPSHNSSGQKSLIDGGNRSIRSAASHWQMLSHNVFLQVHLSWAGFKLTIVVIDTDCIGNCKSNYHTITTRTTSILIWNPLPDMINGMSSVNSLRLYF
jgi:hypothetical protein